MTKILRTVDVVAMTGLSRSTLWRMRRAKTFPEPVRLGVHAIGWPAETVSGWIANRPSVDLGAGVNE